MKALLFFGTTLATLYASLRWEPVFYLAAFLFLLGCAFVLFSGFYHYLGRRGHF